MDHSLSFKQKPNVLLIDPPDYEACAKNNLQLPLGCIALYSYLKNSDVVNDLAIVDLSLNFLKQKGKITYSPRELFKDTDVVNKKWDIIGITTRFTNTLTSLAIAKYFKKLNPYCVVVLGGIHATSCHQSLLENFSYIDLIVLGEGEQSFHTLCQLWTLSECEKSISFHDIPNIAYFSKEEGIFLTQKCLLPLEEIGAYDFSCVDVPDYIRLSQVEAFWIESGRGCVFKCGFCISAKHWGHKCRYFKADKIIQDLATLKAYGINKFSFTHDQFTFDKTQLKNICAALIEENLQVEWGCYSRLSDFPHDDLELMSQAGCRRMFIGIESSMDVIQKSVKKTITDSKLDKALAACKSHNISIESNIIFGFPEHDQDKILDELLYCAKLKLHDFGRVSISALELYPTTDFYKDSKYRDQFYFKSPTHEKYHELFSFKYEFRKKFWGLPVKVFIECARLWSTFFPETITQVLSDKKGKQEFGRWLNDNCELLIRLHSEENLNKFDEFLELILNSWKCRTEISSVMIVECAVALLSVSWDRSFCWSSEDMSVQYNGNDAVIMTCAEFSGDGFLEMDQQKKMNQFKVTHCNDEILIRNYLAA